MKIKTKKEMNLPELIDWAMENEIKDRMFLTKDSYCVGFDRHGYIYFNSSLTMPLNQVFTVETEKEITENTVIPEMLTIYDKGITDLTNNKSLNDFIKNNLKSAYIMNDDLKLILIWRDGKLVN